MKYLVSVINVFWGHPNQSRMWIFIIGKRDNLLLSILRFADRKKKFLLRMPAPFYFQIFHSKDFKRQNWKKNQRSLPFPSKRIYASQEKSEKNLESFENSISRFTSSFLSRLCRTVKAKCPKMECLPFQWLNWPPFRLSVGFFTLRCP